MKEQQIAVVTSQNYRCVSSPRFFDSLSVKTRVDAQTCKIIHNLHLFYRDKFKLLHLAELKKRKNSPFLVHEGVFGLIQETLKLVRFKYGAQTETLQPELIFMIAEIKQDPQGRQEDLK